jgi:hypothetical protein
LRSPPGLAAGGLLFLLEAAHDFFKPLNLLIYFENSSPEQP